MIFKLARKVCIPFPDWVKIPVVAIAKRGSLVSLATIAVALPLLGLRYLFLY